MFISAVGVYKNSVHVSGNEQLIAPRNIGATSSSLLPARPHPTRVTKNLISGFSSVNRTNVSTYCSISSSDRHSKFAVLVGIAYELPTRPSPWPSNAPYRSLASNAAPAPCLPPRLEPNTNMRLSFGVVLSAWNIIT
jgi:hypothetical protein